MHRPRPPALPVRSPRRPNATVLAIEASEHLKVGLSQQNGLVAQFTDPARPFDAVGQQGLPDLNEFLDTRVSHRDKPK